MYQQKNENKWEFEDKKIENSFSRAKQQWVTGPKIHIAAIIEAMEVEAEVHLEEHHPDREDTMEAHPKATINFKTVPNQPAGGATSTDIVKRTVAKESRQMRHAKVSMDRPTGLNKRPHQLEKVKISRKFKEQLVKCTPDIWQPSSRVFNEGRS